MSQQLRIRKPGLEDGMPVFRLIERCPPLDTNSSYCNLLQCGHFAHTSALAELDGEVVGFISGYRLPERPDTLFIWQVAVDEKARGCGLASRMLEHILFRGECRGVSFLETTITPDNQGSWALFRSFAKKLLANFRSGAWLERDRHFHGQHDPESLIRIGPYNLEQLSAA